MELIIDVNEQTYKDIKNYGEIFDGQIHILTKSIINGTPLKEEFEKIKAEIDDLDRHFDNDYFSGNKDSMFKCKEVFKILDNHIKEPKGENK